MKKLNKCLFGSRFLSVLVVSTLAFGVTACVKAEESRGYVKGVKVNVDRIKIGVSDKKDVQYLLGSPSSTSSFGDETWYYIGLRMAQSTYHRPEIVDQDILVVKFNDSGLVEDVTHKGDEERRNISISAESTPTEGNQITILEQLLGNLGRYNGPK
jgi:outer membrane protein assembly factor BamE (lipoprotein component of BamABCDE complex)